MKKFWQGDLLLPFKTYLLTSIIINIIFILIVLLIKGFLPPQVPLFYGLPESEEQLAPSWTLIIPCLAALIIGLVNSGICFLIKDEFVKKALIITSIIASGFAVITTLKIVFLVGSF